MAKTPDCKVLKGIGASQGIGVGRIFILRDAGPLIGKSSGPTSPEAEILRYRAARDTVWARFRQAAANIFKELGPGKGNILDVHALILKDEVLNQEIELLMTDGKRAEAAVETVYHRISERQKLVENEYLKERYTISRDIGRQLVTELLGLHRLDATKEKGDVIVAARELTPFAVVEHPANIKGFVVETGGPTGHAAILARAYGLPLVQGIADIENAVADGTPAILNGATGELTLNPPAARLKRSIELRDQETAEAGRTPAAPAPARTTDGRLIRLLMNIEMAHNVRSSSALEADGVGLFRSEFLFMHKAGLPTEEEQFAAFDKVARDMAPRKVVIRTVDFGGDKHPPTGLDAGKGPVRPGLRGIRYCLGHEEFFATHLRAVLRAGARGNVGVMFPMVPGLETFRQARSFLRRMMQDLRREGVKVNEKMPVGIMVEVPSAALMAESLARVADFFSIGTNDLFKYTLGIDREDASYSDYGIFLPPSIVQLVELVVASARKHDRPVSVCGELAHQLWAAPLLIGLGIDELSMDASHIPAVRQVIRGLSYARCQALARKALILETPEEMKQLLKGLF